MARRKSKKNVSLPVVQCTKPRTIRKSKSGPRRAIVLAIVQLLIIAHIVQWAVTGETITPVEPSESMATVKDGVINAGFIFFGLALLSTVVLGRWFCGWGCHVVMLQDLCAWTMRRVGIRPKPFRSRLLVFVPFALALYMFVAPVVYRFALVPLADRLRSSLGADHGFIQCLHAATSVIGFPLPNDGVGPFGFTWHLTTTDFWATFAGYAVAIPFLLVCGFGVVYLMGSKGFCTYGCPYGGFFAPLDELAPARIRVTDACEHCGHCTSVCTSNVRVHEEVREYGMVVDPGCMKCLDCVSVCPNDALYFGFGKPATMKGKPRNAAPRRHYDLSRREEVGLALVFLVSFLAVRGVYGLIPMLMAAGTAACTTWMTWKLWRMIRDESANLHRFRLKYKGVWRRSGVAFASITVLVLALTGHSGVVRLAYAMGDYHDTRVQVPAAVIFTRDRLEPPESMREHAAAALGWYTLASAIGDGGIGLLQSWQPRIDIRRAWLHSTRFEFEEAEAILVHAIRRRGTSEAYVEALALIQRAEGDVGRTRDLYEEALLEHLDWTGLLDDYMAWARDEGLMDEAARLCRGRLDRMPESDDAFDDTRLHTMRWLSLALVESGQLDEGIDLIRATLDIEPDNAAAWLTLAQSCLRAGRTLEAHDAIRSSLDLHAANPVAHLTAAAILREMGDDDAAQRHIDEATRLSDR